MGRGDSNDSERDNLPPTVAAELALPTLTESTLFLLEDFLVGSNQLLSHATASTLMAVLERDQTYLGERFLIMLEGFGPQSAPSATLALRANSTGVANMQADTNSAYYALRSFARVEDMLHACLALRFSYAQARLYLDVLPHHLDQLGLVSPSDSEIAPFLSLPVSYAAAAPKSSRRSKDTASRGLRLTELIEKISPGMPVRTILPKRSARERIEGRGLHPRFAFLRRGLQTSVGNGRYRTYETTLFVELFVSLKAAQRDMCNLLHIEQLYLGVFDLDASDYLTEVPFVFTAQCRDTDSNSIVTVSSSQTAQEYFRSST